VDPSNVPAESQFTGSIATVSEKGIPAEVDVAIVGSGGAGLMATLTAAKEGARVLVVESRELVGGATGISAGAAWIPAHGFSTKKLKVRDDLDQARRYTYGQGRNEVLGHDLVEAFLEAGPRVARYIEALGTVGGPRTDAHGRALIHRLAA
jgi:succinate dehydrogenase/fumarate reductase flavoprotein subunit